MMVWPNGVNKPNTEYFYLQIFVKEAKEKKLITARIHFKHIHDSHIVTTALFKLGIYIDKVYC